MVRLAGEETREVVCEVGREKPRRERDEREGSGGGAAASRDSHVCRRSDQLASQPESD